MKSRATATIATVAWTAAVTCMVAKWLTAGEHWLAELAVMAALAANTLSVWSLLCGERHRVETLVELTAQALLDREREDLHVV